MTKKRILVVGLAILVGVCIYVIPAQVQTADYQESWADLEPDLVVNGYPSGCHRACKYVPPDWTCLQNLAWETYCDLAPDYSSCTTYASCEGGGKDPIPCIEPCN